MILEIFKGTFEDIINYYNNDCLSKQSIKNNQVKIKFDYKELSQADKPNDLEKIINQVIKEIYHWRQENQSQLLDENFDSKTFAKLEMILSSAQFALESLFECYKSINYLTREENGKVVIDINNKFAVRKILSLASNILSKYEQLPSRLKGSEELAKIIETIKDITGTEDVNIIFRLSSEILSKHGNLLNLDHFINYDALVDEYGWVHDIVKLSRVNADILNLLINIEIYLNILNNNFYKSKGISVME
ncbi:hypothetical protein SHELI_v1c08050 [Spiroplasma helicoides]|uniref:Uncharacterized protein n=1 Tax=Spiroplasma helicoides TaxID=216938 RepID=A0A1B3SLF4_9MOLU|nr:hypothetical protein [Spiroplasma helicoides]AOG60754.1 hypothetical protein SHELI_v1c08050 [Spiroplasma helicoides]